AIPTVDCGPCQRFFKSLGCCSGPRRPSFRLQTEDQVMSVRIIDYACPNCGKPRMGLASGARMMEDNCPACGELRQRPAEIVGQRRECCRCPFCKELKADTRAVYIRVSHRSEFSAFFGIGSVTTTTERSVNLHTPCCNACFRDLRRLDAQGFRVLWWGIL